MAETINVLDGEEIVQARVRGESVRAISKRYNVTPADVNDVLDRFATATITHKTRIHTLALELERLDGLYRNFEQQARGGDVHSGLLLTKIIERRCVLLGLAAPVRFDPHVVNAQTEQPKNSTERIREALDRLCGVRPLLDGTEADPQGDSG
jgi:hypothetical protein